MAEFKEELVINALHPEKAEVGKKYWFADNICELKKLIETDGDYFYELNSIGEDCFVHLGSYESPLAYNLIYPYEEPPKKRMTNRQFSEWLIKGNGEYTYEGYEDYESNLTPIYTTYSYLKSVENHEVASEIKIRTWDSEEWVEPTVDIYERDCKGGKE